MTLVGLAVVHYDKFEPVSVYFNDAYKLAGGSNIVNTILGDFRAFDTMLEVVVLLIAGLGVYTLTKLKPRKEEAIMKINDVILRTVTKAVVFIILTLGVYLFCRASCTRWWLYRWSYTCFRYCAALPGV